mgnify:CR=1 FL=1
MEKEEAWHGGTRHAAKLEPSSQSRAAQPLGGSGARFGWPARDGRRRLDRPAQEPLLGEHPFDEIKVIDYDFAKYGSSDERKRLLEKWEKEVHALPR